MTDDQLKEHCRSNRKAVKHIHKDKMKKQKLIHLK